MLIISIKIDDQTKEFVTMKTRDRDSVIAKENMIQIRSLLLFMS